MRSLVKRMQITLDEGYQFGLGVFETISVEQGHPLFLPWHLERLHHSLEALGIRPRTVDITEASVLSWLSSRQKEQALDHHALKIMVSAENCLFTLRPNHYTPKQYQEGFRMDYSNVYRNETSPLVRHKTMNYGDCILEKRRAGTLGLDELILCNSQGQICEGTTTNLFFVREGILYTPPLSCGLLPGILRRFLLTTFPVREQVLTPGDALAMEECFVTNSLMGIMPVTALAGKIYPIGPVTRACMDAYRTATGQSS